MWLVGNEATHTAFLAALARSHGLSVTVKAYLAGVELGGVPVDAGQVTVSARRRVRRSLDLEAPEQHWPATASDLLSPYGVELRAWWTLIAGATVYPDVPVFTGRVESVSRDRHSGRVRVRCQDRFAAINDAGFEDLRAATAGVTIPVAISILIREVFGEVAVTDLTGSTVTIPTGLIWRDGDGSRGQAIDDLAMAIGAEVLSLPDGNFVIRPMPSLAATPVWTVATGAGGVVVRDSQTKARTGVANRWIVVGEQTTATAPTRAVVTEGAGPLAYGGPFGRVVRRVSSPLVASTAQAYAVGNAFRERVRGLARTRTLEVVANPAVEAGDVLQVEVGTSSGIEREWHIADELTLPLTVSPPTMTIDTRSTEV